MDASFSKTEKVTIVFEGMNTQLPPGFDIKDGELMYARNLDCHKSPTILSVRPGRAVYATAITKPNAFGARANSAIHVQDGTVWKRWDGSVWQTVASGLADASGKILDFVTADKTFTILVNGIDKYSWDGTTLAALSAAPASKLCVAHRYRLYFALSNALQASDLSDFTTYPADCILPITNAKGPLLALSRYNDHVMAWSAFSFHEVYGDSLEDWYVVDINEIGCLGDRCVIEHNTFLWWLDINGAAYKYGGGKPAKVSDKLANEYLKEINLSYRHLCCAGGHENSIFWSIPYKTSTVNNLILEYRTDLDRWYVHTGNISQFVNLGDKLYGISNAGAICAINSGTTDAGTVIEWKGRTKPFNDMSISAKKSLRRAVLVVDLPTGSTFTVGGSKQETGETFDTLYTFTAATGLQKQEILIPTSKLQLADWYRLEFSGTGPADIYYFEKSVGKRGGNF